MGRLDFAKRVGKTFGGQRDLYTQLGYQVSLGIADYRERYQRGGIAERIIEAYPFATWAGGARIIEDPDPNHETDFERDVRVLFDRLDIWSRLTRADVLASLGHYSALLIGAPGDMASPLPSKLPSISYLKPIAEDNAQIATFVEGEAKRNDPRYGQPLTYRITIPRGDARSDTIIVHWTRILHVSEGLLEDDLFGKPRLRAIWNLLDDLDKIIGGGAEAAWKRMDPGMQVDIAPEIELDEPDEQRLSDELDEFQHGLRRYIRTRGTTVTPLSAQVQSFSPNADAVTKLIAATTGIPYRILTGSERGELASTQDRFNWSDRINERRRGFATPLVHQFLSRLIDGGLIRAPVGYESIKEAFTPTSSTSAADYPGGYDIVWPEVGEVSNTAKADVINKLAAAAQAMFVAGQPPPLTTNEIRGMVFGLGPLPDPKPPKPAPPKDTSTAPSDNPASDSTPAPGEPSKPSGTNIPSAPANGAAAGT